MSVRMETRSPEPAPPGGNIEDVPDASAALYRDIVDLAAGAPSWLQSFAGFFTDAAIVLLGGLMVLCWWRARQLPARSMALAVVAPAATVLAYGLSEVVKLIKQVERPCRTLPDVVPIAECPPPGDWSFPSNHSVVAGSAVLGIALAWRALAALALPVGLAAAASRVFVGAHYPHDAVVGLLLGALVVAVLVPPLLRPATRLTARLRDRRRSAAPHQVC
ncbi:undecaprenyl-diphosphatase [Amycolatopsis cihanbeyliensis]|uniref:Undecaprenyl-diphosphatase n=2 Tax=Amycolatopsis cihanbeyliensis TaxID=1128664 RepID=A0A542DIC5_AMYCI|nr:undecaprenyl-diphosphatase [Amycolatopsis cihanbeyliensis]